MKIVKKGAYLGAEISDVDINNIDEFALSQISKYIATHGIVYFPNQKISSDDLMTFGKKFGELSVHPFSTNAENNPELIIYDNKKGNPPALTDMWHADETFRLEPPKITMLCSKIVPNIGGDTLFCNMSKAYEGLSDLVQNYIAGLEAVHDFKPFKTLFSDNEDDSQQLRHYEQIYKQIAHPIVTLHPVTNEKVLNVNPQFTIGIKNMEERESALLLDHLFHQALIPEYQYRHKWEENMLVCWDNRLVQHYAVHDYYPQRRKMHRVTIKGEKPKPAFDIYPQNKIKRLKVSNDEAYARAKRHFE